MPKPYNYNGESSTGSEHYKPRSRPGRAERSTRPAACNNTLSEESTESVSPSSDPSPVRRHKAAKAQGRRSLSEHPDNEELISITPGNLNVDECDGCNTITFERFHDPEDGAVAVRGKYKFSFHYPLLNSLNLFRLDLVKMRDSALLKLSDGGFFEGSKFKPNRYQRCSDTITKSLYDSYTENTQMSAGRNSDEETIARLVERRRVAKREEAHFRNDMQLSRGTAIDRSQGLDTLENIEYIVTHMQQSGSKPTNYLIAASRPSIQYSPQEGDAPDSLVAISELAETRYSHPRRSASAMRPTARREPVETIRRGSLPTRLGRRFQRPEIEEPGSSVSRDISAGSSGLSIELIEEHTEEQVPPQSAHSRLFSRQVGFHNAHPFQHLDYSDDDDVSPGELSDRAATKMPTRTFRSAASVTNPAVPAVKTKSPLLNEAESEDIEGTSPRSSLCGEHPRVFSDYPGEKSEEVRSDIGSNIVPSIECDENLPDKVEGEKPDDIDYKTNLNTDSASESGSEISSIHELTVSTLDEIDEQSSQRGGDVEEDEEGSSSSASSRRDSNDGEEGGIQINLPGGTGLRLTGK